jgi:hypothetical protein
MSSPSSQHTPRLIRLGCPQPEPNAQNHKRQQVQHHSVSVSGSRRRERTLQPCHRTNQIGVGRIAGQVEQIVFNEIPGKVTPLSSAMPCPKRRYTV